MLWFLSLWFIASFLSGLYRGAVGFHDSLVVVWEFIRKETFDSSHFGAGFVETAGSCTHVPVRFAFLLLGEAAVDFLEVTWDFDS